MGDHQSAPFPTGLHPWIKPVFYHLYFTNSKQGVLFLVKHCILKVKFQIKNHPFRRIFKFFSLQYIRSAVVRNFQNRRNFFGTGKAVFFSLQCGRSAEDYSSKMEGISSGKVDLYRMTLSLLDLTPNASAKDIKTAYRKKVLKVYPSLNPGNPEKVKNFHQVT